jgi:hypothetical protein
MIISLLILAFVINVPWLAAMVAGVMLAGTALRQPGFKWVYTGILRPRGLVKPDVIEDNPQPHGFAQGIGGTVLVFGLIAFVLGSPVVGWGLVWLVVALAALNLFVGFCAGCFIYYWLSRWHVPHFGAEPPPNTFPGMRPTRKAS